MNLYENLERIQRIDQLIRLEATGNPLELANILSLSERQVFRIIEQMRFLGAEIFFSQNKNSYLYFSPVKFFFGFLPEGKKIFEFFSN